MLNVSFARLDRQDFRVLCVGAHSDDIEIGCGGTILRLLEENPDVAVHWVVLGAAEQRVNEAVDSANIFLRDARRKEITIKQFREGFFPSIGAGLKDFFEELSQE